VMNEFETLEPIAVDNMPNDYVSEYERWLDEWADDDADMIEE
jgi:hypothetical protein